MGANSSNNDHSDNEELYNNIFNQFKIGLESIALNISEDDVLILEELFNKLLSE